MQQSSANTVKASFDRAMTFLRAGDAIMAEKMCRQALTEFPRDANLLCLLGAAMLKQDKAREAEQTLSRAVSMYPQFARAHETLADALIMQGRLPEGLESLERAAELEPGVASVRFKKAKVLDGLGRDDEATRAFEESFKLTPHKEDLVRGLRLQRMGNIREGSGNASTVSVLLRDPGQRRRVAAARRCRDAREAMERRRGFAWRKRSEKRSGLLSRVGWTSGIARQEQDRTDDAISKPTRTQYDSIRDKPNAYAASATTNGMAGRS